MTNVEHNARRLAAASWFGYGRWDAPYWFMGMEPGGEDEPATYEAWADLDRDRIGLIDCSAHHMWRRNVLGVEDQKWTKWHDGARPPTQPTWRRLIQLLLSFKNQASDLESARLYQRDEWGSKNGETALIEAAAANSPKLSGVVPHREARIATIRKHLEHAEPKFVVMYGLGYREIYAQIAGENFNANGYAWAGNTLCALVEHPVAPSGRPAAWWITKGAEMRSILLRGPMR